MQKATAALKLRTAILELEIRQTDEGRQLKEQLMITYESLKPVNVLKKVFRDITGASEIKDNLIQTATGLITGYITRKILIRSSRNPLLRLAGVFLQYGVTNFVSNHTEAIKDLGRYVIDKLAGSEKGQNN